MKAIIPLLLVLVSVTLFFYIYSGSRTETAEDADGNVYDTLRIGDQVWTVEHWRATTFADGTPIPKVADAEEWSVLSTPAYCYYDNKEENKEKYGVLYNWYAAGSGKIAPEGWRVPDNDDWKQLEEYLFNNGYNHGRATTRNMLAKSLATKTGWAESGEAGTPGNRPGGNNKTGFSAIPAGIRNHSGIFIHLGKVNFLWSSTKYDPEHGHFTGYSPRGYYRRIIYDSAPFPQMISGKVQGLSIRLVRDSE